MEEKCAPGKKYEDGSCFNMKELRKITNAFNDENEDNKISLNLNKEELVKELDEKMEEEYKCEDQKCWLTKKFVKKLNDPEISKFTFRPEGPKGKFTWLSTTNINDVVEQYEKENDDFLFLGTVPYDFEDLPELGIKSLNFKNLNNEGISKIGMVINLDYHYQPGSHWVALYTDLDKNQIYFFDSFGKKPRKKIKNFINKITKYIYDKNYNEKLNINKVLNNLKGGSMSEDSTKLIKKLNKFDIRFNNVQHQFKNSECGVYSINFIIRLVKGQSFDHITKNITDDDDMNDCRKVYFN